MLATPIIFLPSFPQIIPCPGQSAVVLAGEGGVRRAARLAGGPLGPLGSLNSHQAI